MRTRYATDPRRPAPLRRLDRYALLTYLSRRQRHARIQWERRTLDGRLRAWPRTGSLGFILAEEVTTGLGLPEPDSALDLRFRIRGLSFRCEGVVRKLDTAMGRILIKPDAIEWRAKGLEAGGLRLPRTRAQLSFRNTDGRAHRVPILAISDECMSFVCWPWPKKLDRAARVKARLELPGTQAFPMMLTLSSKRPVFPGAEGCIATAHIEHATDGFHQALLELTHGATPSARVA